MKIALCNEVSRDMEFAAQCVFAAALEPFVHETDGRAASARAIGYIRGILEALDMPVAAGRKT